MNLAHPRRLDSEHSSTTHVQYFAGCFTNPGHDLSGLYCGDTPLGRAVLVDSANCGMFCCDCCIVLLCISSRAHKNGQLELECVTPIEAHGRDYWTVLKIEHLVMCLATMGYVYTACPVHVTIFNTGENFKRFQVLWSYTLLLRSPVLMCPCEPIQCTYVYIL